MLEGNATFLDIYIYTDQTSTFDFGIMADWISQLQFKANFLFILKILVHVPKLYYYVLDFI